MKGIAHALFALLAVALAAAAFAPATLVDARLAAATSNALRVADARGTVWRGAGTLTDARGTFAMPLEWTLEALPLVHGEMILRLASAGAHGTPAGEFRHREGSWTIARLATSVPASVLPALVQASVPVALGGTLHVDVPNLAVAPSRVEGGATLRWTGATIAWPALPPLALGEVEVAFAPSGGGFVGTVASRGGDVRAGGAIGLDASRTAVDLTLTPVAALDPALARALAAIGTQEGAATRLRWQGPPLLK